MRLSNRPVLGDIETASRAVARFGILMLERRFGSAFIGSQVEMISGSLSRDANRESAFMLQVKDTLRSTVQLSFDGRVFKTYHGADAHTRFDNEVKVLRHLEARSCPFVPRLLEADARKIRIITTNCGTRVEHLDAQRGRELFAELEKYGVRHDDPDGRNVTYRQIDGRFCVVDFEFATILPA